MQNIKYNITLLHLYELEMPTHTYTNLTPGEHIITKPFEVSVATALVLSA
jgi:hypothetical protein